MSGIQQMSLTAADPRDGMTLAELRSLIGLAEDFGEGRAARVRVKPNLRGGIKVATVTFEEAA